MLILRIFKLVCPLSNGGDRQDITVITIMTGYSNGVHSRVTVIGEYRDSLIPKIKASNTPLEMEISDERDKRYYD